MQVLEGPPTWFSPASSCCCALQVPDLLPAVDQLQEVATLWEPCAPSMLSTMLGEVQELDQLLHGSVGATWKLLQLVSVHAASRGAADKMGCVSQAAPSLDQGQLLVLVDSLLLLLLASSMRGSAEGQDDPRRLSTVLLTVVLERVVGDHAARGGRGRRPATCPATPLTPPWTRSCRSCSPGLQTARCRTMPRWRSSTCTPRWRAGSIQTTPQCRHPVEPSCPVQVASDPPVQTQDSAGGSARHMSHACQAFSSSSRCK